MCTCSVYMHFSSPSLLLLCVMPEWKKCCYLSESESTWIASQQLWKPRKNPRILATSENSEKFKLVKQFRSIPNGYDWDSDFIGRLKNVESLNNLNDSTASNAERFLPTWVCACERLSIWCSTKHYIFALALCAHCTHAMLLCYVFTL